VSSCLLSQTELHDSSYQVNVFKEPITDMGKKSKKGRLTLECDNGQWSTTQEGTGDPNKVCLCMHALNSDKMFTKSM